VLAIGVAVVSIDLLTALCTFILDPLISGRVIALAGFTSPRMLTMAVAALCGLLITRYEPTDGSRKKLVIRSVTIAFLSIFTSIATRFALGSRPQDIFSVSLYTKHFAYTSFCSFAALYLIKLLCDKVEKGPRKAPRGYW